MDLVLILFIVFLVLKLGAVGVFATWSWWLVCSPLIIGFALCWIFRD
jgi:hypothetical protein